MRFHSKLWIIPVFLILFCIFKLFGCDIAPAFYDVEYRVYCEDKTIDIRYRDGFGRIQDVENVRPPWTLSFTAARGCELYVSATRTELLKIRTVTVEIHVDGERVAGYTDYQNADESYSLF